MEPPGDACEAPTPREGGGGAGGSDDGSDSSDADAVSRRIAEWQTRLLQLNRRNNLLYFRPGRSTVGITDIAPDELDDRLGRSRNGLSFPYAPPRPVQRSGFAGEDDPADEAADPPAVGGDLTTDCDVADLQRRLRNLRRRDREWEEEQGLNVLFLAMGFLDWVDADGEQARSPLVLIPCDLERTSPRDPFRLCREDDDAVVNPTLRHQLSVLGVDLHEFDVDSSEHGSLGAYIEGVGALVADRAGWSVDSEIVLGAFSYSKLAMYEDLTRMRQHGARSELTRLLAAGGRPGSEGGGGGAGPATPAEADLAAGRLDDLLDVRDQFAVPAGRLQPAGRDRSGAQRRAPGHPRTARHRQRARPLPT